jgi:tetratricopeptide (TPR) repeat protein
VLHGSLFSAGAKLKLRLNLLDRSEDRVEWSQVFAGTKDDIFEFQESVATQVSQALTGGEGGISIVSRPSTKNTEAYDFYLKGRDYYRREGQDNLQFAIQMFDKALEIDAKYATAHAGLADAYAQMYVMYYDRDRKWLKKAETSAKTALILDPNLPEAHRALGRIMMEYGQNEEAIKEFQTAIRQRPDFHEAYRTLAWIYQGMRRYSDSIDWGQKSLRMKPMDRETYLLLGLNYLDLREWDKARHHFERAIELSPDYGRAYMHLGNVRQKTGDLEGALKLYRTALKYLMDVNAYLDLGWVQILMRKLDGAREAYDHLIAEGAMEFTAFYQLGLIDDLEGRHEKALGRYESAISICRKQLANDPDNPYCLATLAQAQARLGKKDEAIATAGRAAAMESGNGAITLELARVRAICGDSGGALVAIAGALHQPMGPSVFEITVDPHFADLDLSQLPAESK